MTPAARAAPVPGTDAGARNGSDSRTGADPSGARTAGAGPSGARTADAAAGAAGSDRAAAFWSARPRRRLDWRDQDDGRAVVLRPKFGESRAGRWLAARLGDPCYRIRLDEVGAFIWRACDGETPLLEIAARLRAKFGARVEPAEERLARFVRTMLRSRMVATERLDADSSGGRTVPRS